ncbi:flagellin [Marinimicrobium sp. ABcell2]|uniref:flagellin N-terminal helical domain-containing protein n=1 Tax=Marinimicrobium sp. ABcell2 TaxID=3069751 RepID=UPI0027B02022|nr:flagellin [Marinimicrobium sp. ABcell2]MDQ2077346.1 flagellin [Marinimicrobium sp. ABcell2]
MSLVINTNVASLNSQRQLMQSGNALDQATERLSSGNRINSAKDDAAGLAIANRMTSQTRGLDQAIRNANDGVSMIQTAEGALQETTNILQRMRELAIQSANGIYSDGDRATLNAEVAQLVAEMDRISTSTSFNGQKLLDGTLGQVNLQVGSESNQVISVEVGAMDSKTLGGMTTGDVIGAAATDGLAAALNLITGQPEVGEDGVIMTINGQSVGDLSGADNLAEALSIINSNIAGVEASAFTEMTAGAEGDGVLRGSDVVTLTLNDPDGQAQTFEIGNTGSMSELVDKINAKTGGQIKAEINDSGRLVLSNAEGGSINVTGDAALSALGIDGSVILVDGDGDPILDADNNEQVIGTTQEAQLVFTITDSNIKNVDIAFEGVNDGDDVAAAQAIGVNARSGGDISGFMINDGPDTAGDGTTSTLAGFAEGDLVINGVSIGAVADTTATQDGTDPGDVTQASGADHAAKIAEAINKLSSETGVVASVGDNNNLVLNSVDGKEMSISLSGAATTENTGLLVTNDAATLGNSIADLDISTQAGAQRAIDTIDRALTAINDTRADLGAINNRLDFTVSNLANISEKTSAAKSRIMDADFAAETAALSRSQVLQQAASAMLAQANARPQQVLQLLQ